VLKEALSNAARHANASYVAVELRREHGALHITVRDDGEGFDVASQHAGHGLEGMRRRADLLGATLAIRSERGTGTTIELELRG
jgi:signal transduction histidine kinase